MKTAGVGLRKRLNARGIWGVGESGEELKPRVQG